LQDILEEKSCSTASTRTIPNQRLPHSLQSFHSNLWHHGFIGFPNKLQLYSFYGSPNTFWENAPSTVKKA